MNRAPTRTDVVGDAEIERRFAERVEVDVAAAAAYWRAWVMSSRSRSGYSSRISSKAHSAATSRTTVSTEILSPRRQALPSRVSGVAVIRSKAVTSVVGDGRTDHRNGRQVAEGVAGPSTSVVSRIGRSWTWSDSRVELG
jgi:hypothetical protein